MQRISLQGFSSAIQTFKFGEPAKNVLKDVSPATQIQFAFPADKNISSRLLKAVLYAMPLALCAFIRIASSLFVSPVLTTA